MGNPIQYVYYTAAGTIEMEVSEEAVRESRYYGIVTHPTEGRGRLVGALIFWLQEKLDKADEKPWFWIVDKAGSLYGLRPSAISGFRILEPIGEEVQEQAQIGFRPR
jgi:hypothetical protein